MGYSDLEKAGGKPRELYTFARSDQLWRYASGATAVSVTYPIKGTPTIYPAAVISRGRIQRSNETGTLTVHVTLAHTLPVAAALREFRTMPMVLGIHRQQDDPSSLPVLMMYGNVANVTLNEGLVEVDVISDEARFGQPFPKLLIDRTCQLAFGSARCGVNEDDFGFDTTITAIGRSQLTLAATALVPPEYYDAGQIVFTATRERAFIAKRLLTGPTFFIFGQVPSGVAIGDAVKLIAGDDKSRDTCRDKFNNVANFFGFNELPSTDPMVTGIVV